MSVPTDLDKLRILLSHWVEHNHKHSEEFFEWVKRIERLTSNDVVFHLRSAGEEMEKVTAHLRAALKHLGGSPEKGH
jgi:GrpB-like predicted nucleotidyltransferase (UPF0157 family)